MHRIAIVMLAGLGCAAVLLSSAVLGIVAVLSFGLVARRHAHHGLTLLLVVTMGCAGVVRTDPSPQGVAVRPLSFKGRLADGARAELPSLVAAALDPGADAVFTYDERITQTHDELPFVVMMITATLHLLGVPSGRDEVTARAELTITRHDREIGRYRAEAKASQIYGLYYGADVLALETQARTAVRRAIDEALSGDAARLTSRVDSPQP